MRKNFYIKCTNKFCKHDEFWVKMLMKEKVSNTMRLECTGCGQVLSFRVGGQ